ncbi:MAG: ZIP family metal transporter [Clostridia bacterium]|nr:ZIP family metal transporter [Clostridia bacterium]
MWYTWIKVFGFVFVFMMTALGAAVVYFFKGEIPPKINAAFLGFASGVMLAASVWSLLLPAIEQAETNYGKWSFLPAAIGFLLGGVFLTLLDKIAGKFYHGEKAHVKSARLFFAVTMHNIPEGLAVGFAFGVAAVGDVSAFLSALFLAIGIGVQNFPEGAAISLPLKPVLKSSHKAFFWGAASGIAEPIFATVGYFLASVLHAAQPWLLAFSAGAMIFVAAQDLIPDAKNDDFPRLGAWGVSVGFVIMMILDVALGG